MAASAPAPAKRSLAQKLLRRLVIAVVLLVVILVPSIIMATGTSVAAQGRAFTVYDIKLAADQTARHEHAWSTIGVLLSGTIEQGGIPGEEPSRLRAAGQWLTLPRAQAHTLTAVGGDAHVIEIEAR